MLASQLIYTSWKNGDSPNKGYMVYSKSQDITEAESLEIQAVMRYTPPTNLPYTPTKEEIDTIFPKNFAYFKLSSGRFCIAQSCYIGQDYTGRWGNYIIHAYVVADIEDVLPTNLIGQDLFRTCLTEEELNAPAAPAFLPQVELDLIGTAMSQADLEAFFDSDSKKQFFRYLVQNALTAVSQGKRINFYEGMETIPVWLKAMALVLPRSVVKNLYFCTYAIDSSDLLTMACFLPDSNMSGGYSFDTNLVSIYASQGCESDGAGEYVSNACGRLFADYYSGVLCAGEINTQLTKYETTDCDRVMKLVSLAKGDPLTVESVQELASLTDTLYQYDSDRLGAICENVFQIIRLRSEFQSQEGVFQLYRKIFVNLSNTSKEDLLLLYLRQKLIVCADKQPQEVYDAVKADCPCDWLTAIKTLIKESVGEQIKAYNTTNSEMLLVFAWLDAYPLCKGEASDALLDKVKPYYQKYVSAHSEALFDLILQRCKALSEVPYVVMLKSITETNLAFFAQDVAYLFSYLDRALNHGGAFWSVLCKVVYLHPSATEACIAAYVKLLEREPEKGMQLNRMAEQHAEIKNFIDGVALYSYARMPAKSISDLQLGYSKYVLADYGSVALAEQAYHHFLAKMRSYFGSLSVKDQLRDAWMLYRNLCASVATVTAREQQILSALFDIILKDRSFSELEKYIPDSKIVSDLVSDGEKYGFSKETLLYARVYLEGVWFKIAAVDNKNRITAIRFFLKTMAESQLYCFAKDTPPSILNEFAECYLDSVLKTVYAIYDMGESNHFDQLLHAYLQPFFTSVPDYEKRMQKLWKKDSLATNAHLKLYFEYIFTQTGAFRDHLKDQILEDYLESLGGKRKEVFKAIEKSLEHKPELQEQFQRYAESFDKNHVGFFGRIFGAGKNKVKKGENDNEQKQD